MSDQADTLRRLMQQRIESAEDCFPETVLFAGAGKEAGTGFLMRSLSRQLTAAGQKVLLFDEVREHFGAHEKGGWSQAFLRSGGRPDLLFVRLDDLEVLPQTPRNCVIVTLADPASFQDSICLIRALRARSPLIRLSVIVNRVTCPGEARQTYLRLREIVDSESETDLAYLGHCLEDQSSSRSVPFMTFLLESSRRSEPRQCLELLAKRLASRSLGDVPSRR